MEKTNDLQIFNNPKFGQVRMVEINGKAFAVGIDIANMLEYKEPHKAVSAHCRGGISYPVMDSLGRAQQTKVIPEGDIYRLIVKAAEQSKNPEIKARAEEAESWIFDEVVPSVVNHGGYLTPQKIEEVLLDPDTIIQLATSLKEEREKSRKLKLETLQKDQIIGELQPKATYYDLVLQSKSLLSVTKIAKDFGLSAKALNMILHEEGVQYKQGDCWLLYQKYANSGYTQSKSHVIDEENTKFNTYWTQKGRLFIYELLKNKRGLLPLIEQTD